jgi:copper transporter 1
MDTSMTMPMSGSPTNNMGGMVMPTSTDSPSSGMATMMNMNMMAMTFFTSTTTPLFSTSWTPASTGQYAGTCIFLIAFATIFRALIAVRINFVDILVAFERHHTGGAAHLYVADAKPNAARPWRAYEAVLSASIDVVLASVGYLLSVLLT